jgi:hypothetical protein
MIRQHQEEQKEEQSRKEEKKTDERIKLRRFQVENQELHPEVGDIV